jgi:hypothetical protein
LLAGCGGDNGSRDSQHLDRAVAERLAVESDAVADAIAANDGCEAERRLAALRSSASDAAVPEAVRQEVERFAGRTFTCAPPPPPPQQPPPPPPATVSTEDAGDDHGDGHGKGHKKHKDKKHGRDDGGDG